MIDLIKFYYDDLKDKKAMYYNTFENFYDYCTESLADDRATIKIEVYDVEDAINKFINLVRPSNDYPYIEKFEFILVCYFLYKNGYYIKEFPSFLERPSDLATFSNNEIKNLAAKKYGRNGNYQGVAWHDRELVVSELEFVKRELICVDLDKDLNDVFKLVSARNNNFENMTLDEKLGNIVNVFAHIVDSKKKIPFGELTNNYITDEQAKKFNGELQCFRHGEKDLIEKRKQFSDSQKNFMINFGLTLLAVAKIYIDDNK